MLPSCYHLSSLYVHDHGPGSVYRSFDELCSYGDYGHRVPLDNPPTARDRRYYCTFHPRDDSYQETHNSEESSVLWLRAMRALRALRAMWISLW